jgi:hypothetical protein
LVERGDTVSRRWLVSVGRPQSLLLFFTRR